jgi:predicted N-acetyltransferase YhbS
MIMNIKIRQEVPADFQAVFDMVEAAFRTMPFADGDEHFLLVKLRKNKAFIPELSIVAEINTRLVGHILFTPYLITDGDAVFHSLAMGPVSVLPEYQRHGIGSRLIQEGHNVARSLGFTSCFLVGHPDYYPRFGYVPAAKWGFLPPHGAPSEAFMAIELVPGALNGVTGKGKFLPEFGVD